MREGGVEEEEKEEEEEEEEEGERIRKRGEAWPGKPHSPPKNLIGVFLWYHFSGPSRS